MSPSEELVAARANLWKAQERFKQYPKIRVIVNEFAFCMSQEHGWSTATEPWIRCTMPEDLLTKILRREVHWNNCEVGCLITFDRRGPYMPDVHTLLSFFHLPREGA